MSKYHYQGPSIDHTLLSPSGRVSKRAREAAHKRDQERIDAWFKAKYPDVPPTAQEQRTAEVESLQRHAARLRDLAARGMSTRRFMREAAEAEAKAAELQRMG